MDDHGGLRNLAGVDRGGGEVGFLFLRFLYRPEMQARRGSVGGDAIKWSAGRIAAGAQVLRCRLEGGVSTMVYL